MKIEDFWRKLFCEMVEQRDKLRERVKALEEQARVAPSPPSSDTPSGPSRSSCPCTGP